MIKDKPVLFLKSIYHLRVSDDRVNYIKSLFTGAQYFYHLPYEIVSGVVFSLFANIVNDLYDAARALIHLMAASFYTLVAAIGGYLYAASEPLDHGDE